MRISLFLSWILLKHLIFVISLKISQATLKENLRNTPSIGYPDPSIGGGGAHIKWNGPM
jgi:hypothetical protein